MIDDVEISKLVMGFLRHAGYHETCSSLQLESGVGQGKMDDELLYLQKLTLQGRWDDCLRYLQPMRRILLHNFERLEFMIKKQQYLEALSWLGAGGQRHSLMPWRPPKNKPGTPAGKSPLDESCMTFGDDEEDIDMDSVAALLKQLEGRCPLADFNHLCTLLTLERLSDDDTYRTWTVAQGRLSCFQSLRNALHKILPGENEPLYEDDKDVQGGRLRHLVICGLAIERHRGEGGSAGGEFVLPAGATATGAERDPGADIVPAAAAHAQAQPASPSRNPYVETPEGAAEEEAKETLNVSATNIYFEEEDTAAAEEVAKIAAAAAREVHVQQAVAALDAAVSSANGREDDDHLFTVTASPIRTNAGSQQRAARPMQNIYSDENSNFGFPDLEEAAPEDATAVSTNPASPLRAAAAAGNEKVQVLIDDTNNIEIHMPRKPKGSMLPVPSSFGTRSGGLPPQQQQQQQQQQRAMPNKKPATVNVRPDVRPVSWTVDVGGDNGAIRSPARGGGKGSSSASSPTRSVGSARTAATATTVGSGQTRYTSRRPPPSDFQSVYSDVTDGNTLPAATGGVPPPLPFERPAKHPPPHGGGYGSSASVASGTSAYSRDTTATAGYSARHASPSKLQEFSLATTTTGRSKGSDNSGGGGATVVTRQTAATAFTVDSVAPLPADIQRGVTHAPRAQQAQTHTPYVESTVSNAAAVRKAVVAPDGDRSVQALEYHRAWVTRGHSAPTWEVFQRAPCPLRCLHAVRSAQGDLEVIVGSNNRSISHLRRSADLGGASAAAADIVSEWVECHRGSVYCLDYSAGQQLFASGSNDKTVRLGKLRNAANEPIGFTSAGELSAPMKGHSGTVRVVKFAPPLTGVAGGSSSSAPNLHLLASAGAGDNKPRLWDVATGSSYSTLYSHNAPVHGLVWLDGTTLLTGCEEGHIIAHDVRMSGTAWRYTVSGGGICTMLRMPHPQDTTNKWIASGQIGGTVSVFNARTGAVMASDRLHKDDVRSLDVLSEPKQVVRSFSGISRKIPGMPSLVTASFDGTAALWGVAGSNGGNADRGRFDRLASLAGAHGDKILGCCVLPHSQNILTSGADGVVALWSPPTTR